MRKTILQKQYSCCVQKIAQRNTKYPRAHEKGIAHAKCLEWVKPFKYAKKNAKNHSTRRLELFCTKNRSEKKNKKKTKTKQKTKTKAKQKQNKKQIFEK